MVHQLLAVGTNTFDYTPGIARTHNLSADLPVVGVFAIDSVQGRADLIDVPLHCRQPVRVLGDGARARQHDVEVRRFLWI